MHMAGTSSATLILVLHLVTRLRISIHVFHLRVTNLPGSYAVLKLSNVAWSVTRPKMTACVYASDLHNKPPRTLWPRNPSPAPRSATHHLDRPNGKTQCFGFRAGPNRLWTSAPSVNGLVLSVSSVFGPPVSHLCPQRVVSQFHSVSPLPQTPAHLRCRSPPVVSGFPVSCAGLGPEQSKRLSSLRCTWTSETLITILLSEFSLTHLDTLASSLCLCLCLCLCLAPGSSLLWGLGALTDTEQERTGFLIMPKRSYEWRVDSHGCYKFDNAQLGFGPRDQSAHLVVFLHLRSSNVTGPQLSHAQPSGSTQTPELGYLDLQPVPPGFHRFCFGDSSDSHFFNAHPGDLFSGHQ